uniref:Uncharacterized protein n=1 Tax=Magallana gigas TaxID=29159 RepID=K1RDD0_MAGGI
MENMFRKIVLVSLVCCCVYDFRVFSRCVNSPHFVSPWTEVEAQTQKSSVTLEHECGEFPAKVELQIRPSSGNWTNFYFPGIGSSQRDDDINRTYGGIVYKYNKDEVILFIPKAKDGYPSGTIIYTVSGSFLEIAHNQGTIPDLVTVQIQQSGTEWLSDGIGSMTALGPNTSSWGGVIYGYNTSHIKADTGYNSGFMFPASGAVQNDETVSSFGGVVYSASSDTLRIWTPVSPGPGYLLYISNEWGNTLYPQTSTTATLVVHVWKSTTSPIVVPTVIGGFGLLLLIAGLIIARVLWKRKSKNRVVRLLSRVVTSSDYAVGGGGVVKIGVVLGEV